MSQPQGTKRYRLNKAPHFAVPDRRTAATKKNATPQIKTETPKVDKRLERLRARKQQQEEDKEERLNRHKQIVAEVIEEEDSSVVPELQTQLKEQLSIKSELPDSPGDDLEETGWNPARDEDREKLRKERLKAEEEQKEEADGEELPFRFDEMSRDDSNDEFESYEEYSSSDDEDRYSNLPSVKFVPKFVF
eukprot:TRINITY_DN1844_c0_g1_i2.p1 TRINITY_DN1844_c0_g1~~TRINITY_DN1844_c0_g1_i2.p1  ORF type:complete len:191 (+),score=58.84 TRINITY_DN1844_c0_g1_i2:49-621(+)